MAENEEERILRWFNECDSDSDYGDNCSEHIDHDSVSEISDLEDNSEELSRFNTAKSFAEIVPQNGELIHGEPLPSSRSHGSSRGYWYGSNKFKWSKTPLYSSRYRRKNIVTQLPGLAREARRTDIFTASCLLTN
ncbi:unnamed protein product [Parnassius apollo]|uniref:(apollo) hypothetical protein n=1 Tax=Parnassius apollo TaxID=110799 RepID=A0A8S3XPX0_PARAO|nr:unnamed protein product [Parnassius apollo]